MAGAEPKPTSEPSTRRRPRSRSHGVGAATQRRACACGSDGRPAGSHDRRARGSRPPAKENRELRSERDILKAAVYSSGQRHVMWKAARAGRRAIMSRMRLPRLTTEEKAELWSRWRAGESSSDIARAPRRVSGTESANTLHNRSPSKKSPRPPTRAHCRSTSGSRRVHWRSAAQGSVDFASSEGTTVRNDDACVGEARRNHVLFASAMAPQLRDPSA